MGVIIYPNVLNGWLMIVRPVYYFLTSPCSYYDRLVCGSNIFYVDYCGL